MFNNDGGLPDDVAASSCLCAVRSSRLIMGRAREMRKWGLDIGLQEMAFLLSLDRSAVRLRRPPTSLLVGWVVPGAVKAS